MFKHSQTEIQSLPVSTSSLSLCFCISHPACDVVIPGAKNPDQVKENVIASDLDFISFEEF